MRARSGRQFQHSQYSLVRLTLDTLYALAPVTRRYALCITFTQEQSRIIPEDTRNRVVIIVIYLLPFSNPKSQTTNLLPSLPNSHHPLSTYLLLHHDSGPLCSLKREDCKDLEKSILGSPYLAN